MPWQACARAAWRSSAARMHRLAPSASSCWPKHAQLTPARASLREAVSRAVLDALGEPADEIVLAPPHTVLKTSSGKVRRSACRAVYEQGRVGAPRPRVPRQVLRLAFGALALRLRYAAAAAGRAAFASYAMLVFALLAPPTWLASLLTRTPAGAWRLGRGAVRLLLR